MTTTSTEAPEPTQSPEPTRPSKLTQTTEPARSSKPMRFAEEACSSNPPKEPEHAKHTECTKEAESPAASGERSGSVDPLTEPGCYVCNWSGQLIRVSDDASESVGLDILEKEKGRIRVVTRISNDPFLPLGKARMIAANWNLPVRF